jgi:hypothetical protein
MHLPKSTWITGAAVILAAVVSVGAQQMVTITQETVTTNPLGGPGPGGGLNRIPQGAGLILGQVVDGGTNRPVPGALVTLGLPGSRPIRALADAQGRFVFRDLPKGRFNLTTTKPGYVDGAYGRMRPSGPTLPYDLGDGEKASGVTMAVWRYAAITGTVQDELGEPVVGTSVRVLRRQIIGGKWQFTPGAQDQTDDRGIYRIGTLEPGEYAVAVAVGANGPLTLDVIGGEMDRVMSFAATTVRVGAAGGEIAIEGFGSDASTVDESGRPLAYPTLFYANANSAVRATLVKLGSGEERSNVDFQLKPVRSLKVSGIAMGPEGPIPNLQLSLVPAEAEAMASAFDTKTAFSAGGGAFTFPSVPPGQYILRASRTPRFAFGGPGDMMVVQGGAVMGARAVVASGAPPLPADPVLWAEMQVSVGTTDVTDLNVMLRPGFRITGIAQFDGAIARPEGDQLNVLVMIEPADVRPGLGPSRGRIESSGQFSTMGVPPGRYFVRVAGAPPGWTFRGATVGGRDVTDNAIDITSDLNGVTLVFADKPTELAGTITGDSANAIAATVLVFPTDQSAWVGYGASTRRLRNARVDKTGAFSISNIPAGEYYVVGVAERTAVDWQNPEFLASLVADAVRVRLSDGLKTTQNVKVSR